MVVRLAESDSRLLRRPLRARRRVSRRRARHIRFATWTVLAVTLVSLAGTIARPERTSPSKGRQPRVAPVAIVVGGAIEPAIGGTERGRK